MSSIKYPTLSVMTLLHQDRYVIPLYQRNYAWTKKEITQLLDDIRDQYLENDQANYYLGTLVVDLRPDGMYEIIDGQQRHTTLTLISAVINGLFSGSEVVKTCNLHFEARENVKTMIDAYYSDFANEAFKREDSSAYTTIIHAIRDISTYIENLEKVIKEQPGKTRQGYFKFFYEQVKILRVDVPPGTDINHYFEIMNNRGEQLEKHEILKARFLDSVRDHPVLQRRFTEIWDACSQMGRYVPVSIQPITPEEWRTLLPDGALVDTAVSEISQLKPRLHSGTDKLRTILSEKKVGTAVPKDRYTDGHFRSVIDFPNFLLQVLRLTDRDTVSLDDKKLLDEFSRAFPAGSDIERTVAFINQLLFYRQQFDRYVIKQDTSEDEHRRWSIKRPDDNKGTISYTLSFAGNQRIAMLQSMLHVSFTANTYKQWLQLTLRFLKRREGQVVKEEELYETLYEYSKTYLLSSKQTSYHCGTGVPHYIFNYLDYLLWDLYVRFVQGKEQRKFENVLLERINQSRGDFETFRFTPNTSVEHVAPRHPADGEPAVPEPDRFGNLCLISRSSNSRLSNHGFRAKKEYFDNTRKQRKLESLKQRIIFTYERWSTLEIDEHGEEMITLLEGDTLPSSWGDDPEQMPFKVTDFNRS